MHKLVFYVPESHLEKVKNALFAVGAGKVGNYDCCSWQTKGKGQCRPLENSKPFSGEKNKICTEVEFLVEMICEDHVMDLVITTLLKTHPYETPAFQAWQVRAK